MAWTNPDRRLSFSLSGQKAGQKQKGQILAVSAQLMALVSALGSLSSVALSSVRVTRVYHPSLSSLPQGDISTLQKRGHLYFALTVFSLMKMSLRGARGFADTCAVRQCGEQPPNFRRLLRREEPPRNDM